MRNSSRAENSMMLSASKMPRASAEKIDELFGRRLTRSFGPDMAAAAVQLQRLLCQFSTHLYKFSGSHQSLLVSGSVLI